MSLGWNVSVSFNGVVRTFEPCFPRFCKRIRARSRRLATIAQDARHVHDGGTRLLCLRERCCWSSYALACLVPR